MHTSLITTICSSLEQIWKEKNKDVEVNRKENKMQHSLTKYRLYQINLVSLFDKITDFRDKGNMMDLIQLHFSEEFHAIPSEKLLVKLEKMGLAKKKMLR